MEEAEESAAEAEAERRRRFHLVGEARIVEPQSAHGGAQRLEVCGIDRKEPAEHHWDGGPEAWQRRCGRLLVVGDGVADPGVGDLFDRRGQEADLARAKLGGIPHLGREHADLVDLIGRVGAHQADALTALEGAVDDA